MATLVEPAISAQPEDQVVDSIRIRHLLSDLIDPERILIRPIERIAFASDASFYRLIPRAVIQTQTAEEIKHLFRFSHEHRIPLVFRAGGTSLSGQAITDGILVDIGRYWRNVRVEQNGKTSGYSPASSASKPTTRFASMAERSAPTRPRSPVAAWGAF